ncbi:MAG TPA: YrdB family protein [Ktedonobacterales bacterium]|nr:YrdB family protein [Ktedonobacterales bacterium]
MLAAIRYSNLAVAFLVELAALAALGYWGVQVGNGTAAKIALGVGAPLLMIVAWWLFIAPRAVVTVPRLVNLALRILVFGLAVAALAVAGRPDWAWVFGVVVAANLALVRALGD